MTREDKQRLDDAVERGHGIIDALDGVERDVLFFLLENERATRPLNEHGASLIRMDLRRLS